ncbi:HNH endonuclease [Rhizobium leguminosarum bv. viciae]|nr:HNH endonuclease [Rhizobium leguminosarum bv. viciae]
MASLKRSEDAEKYRRLYRTAAWRRIRHQQLALQPLCEWCLEREVVTEATEVHHGEAHRGNLELFFNGPFISTCKPCHSSRGQREDLGQTVLRFGPDGWPL